MKKYLFLLSILSLIYGCASLRTTSNQDEKYVVVLSLDAFRYDYPEIWHTPTLDSLARVGVKGAFYPSFPSLTFPNHYSMATGLYPNNSGIVHNTFIRPDGAVYRIGDRDKVEDPSFYKGEPIWNTAERQGVKSASYFWVGSETKVNGHQPSIWKKFDSSVPFESRGDSIISWLSLPEKQRPHLLMWYIEEPDHTSHTYTPYGVETKKVVEDLDKLVGDFCHKMNQLSIADKINFILVSDHGMASYKPQNYINLKDYLPLDSFRYVAEGAPTLLYTSPTYIETAYDILSKIPNIKVWKKGNIPAKYHYGTSDRISNIVVLPDVGTQLQFREKSSPSNGAAHGFDNYTPEMRAIFYGSGPSFPKGKKVKPIENVNLYLLICKLLNLTTAPNDGKEKDIELLIK